MSAEGWKESLHLFFSNRGRQASGIPTLADLCYVSGRDPRLWLDNELYDDLISSIADLCSVGFRSHILEVGCASGFLALGLSKRVAAYCGVDIAKPALQVARRMKLANATFRRANGTAIPVRDNMFDAAVCYDVVTNFPSAVHIMPILKEMLRVVKPGGKVLIGSIPDAEYREQYERRVAEVTLELDRRHGPAPSVHKEPGSPLIARLSRLCTAKENVAPEILCYYFERSSFVGFGAQLGVAVELADIHHRNPYAGLRFNALYTKSPL